MKLHTNNNLSSIVSSGTRVVFVSNHDRCEYYMKDDASSVLQVGIKDKTPLTRRRFITLVRRVVREIQARKIASVCMVFDDIVGVLDVGFSHVDALRLFAENTHMAGYEYRVYKEKPKDGWGTLEELTLFGDFRVEEKQALVVGEMVAREVNACRDLANTPGGDMTPQLLAREIIRASKGTGATVKVLGKKEMETLKMGAILGVGRGAKEEPKFIIVEYRGTKKRAAPIVLVGKGITFDTGGLSLKPADYMLDMHLDMSGGSAVAHAVFAVARMKVPVHVIALIPSAENAVSGESYRPGDVLRSMSGKTIDVLNTDAEGRIVLADALTYAKRYKPSLIIDVATLTGASLVALGTKANAVMSPDDTLASRVCRLGEESGDYCWQLPLWEEYKDMVKGRHGDIANIPIKNSREAGTIGGGMFLAEFVEGPWVHIDMAPRMVSCAGDFLAEGAAGAPVRLLVRLLEEEGKKTL